MRLYAFWKNFVEKLNGIFAFAIWDDTNRELLLYRDRAGTKPLFYTQTGSSFVFGSEPKALFCHPDVTPSIDKNSLQEILAVGPARTSGNGVFTGVKEVMPGHYHIFCRTDSTTFSTGICPAGNIKIPMPKPYRPFLFSCVTL